MLAICVLTHKYYFIVIAMIYLWNPVSLIADSCKLLAQFLVVIDIDTRVVDFLVLWDVIERSRYYSACKINKSNWKRNMCPASTNFIIFLRKQMYLFHLKSRCNVVNSKTSRS